MDEAAKQKALKDYGITKEYIEDKMRENSWGHVYFIKCHQFYKVGRSFASPESRLLAMQVGNPYELELIFSIRTPHYLKTEKMLHELYKREGYHKRGEWFEIPFERVAKMIKELKDDEEAQTYEQTS